MSNFIIHFATEPGPSMVGTVRCAVTARIAGGIPPWRTQKDGNFLDIINRIYRIIERNRAATACRAVAWAKAGERAVPKMQFAREGR